ncbi:hypothetical protein GLOIN_2v1786239 [Rhizophagus irregularis DAOM 181602=DAOM 197198]|uniref:ATPase domain-containing protein n=1 Tax=Rhizophagus irregularis (strain DAOM 181602 / DAOM 197198 / MUCL 43194) TaxID=747089 RepID=A0A2P4P8K9_RHIID|nr:hypothetical protein GLOIN_2v1786239 [Rhizophagus irregularis DAOM 181602=DAOM 197198]POG61726.1 hypothetical protein GLOIN_2v1786239 [Rhizophagus irregularis DAOM 181602=DAOM 197198]|eukprot:XP_025168592.1 hypothetical protein GLOIN_2v1786239 [Rhizophagus irregularis DAOM 181602=DAOM 197198]
MLSNGYIARYNTKANVFFNRTRELRYFRNAFSNEQPRLHVILGPPSTGKTALIREITTKNENFSPLFINCRNGQFDSPENVYNSLSIQFKTLADKQMKYLEKLPNELEIKDKILDFVNFVAEKGKEKITSDRVSELLSKIVGTLRIGTFGMIESQLQIPHVTPYVVGDLSIGEAEDYFEKHVLPQHGCEELKGKFDHVRRITGTRMLIINMYVSEYKNNGGKLEYDEFSVFRQEDDKLRTGLDPFGFPGEPIDPLWDRNDLIKVMKKIVEAENKGFVLERDLIEEIGIRKLHSLVYNNFLHRRQTNMFANDINAPNEVILTAMNQPSLRAMERLLKILA